MEIKKFRNKYELELIPASNSNIMLGDLVWDPIIGKPVFNHNRAGMPSHIYNAFKDSDYIDANNLTLWQNELKAIELVDAHFAERKIDVDASIANTLEMEQIDGLKQSFDLKSLKKFSFGDLKARTMPDPTRIKIDDYLEDLKKNDWAAYDGKIRRVFMITELYFGSINITIDSNLKNSFETAIPQANMEVKSKVELGRSTSYSFDHQNVPFAMRIERVKHFNG